MVIAYKSRKAGIYLYHLVLLREAVIYVLADFVR